MARYRTLTSMISAVRRNTDNRDSSGFVTDAELTDIINEQLAELHARLTFKENSPHFRSQHTITVTAGTPLYLLNADFYKVQEVTGTYNQLTRPLGTFMIGERADLLNTQAFGTVLDAWPRYRIQADYLELLPANRDMTLDVFYTRACPVLVNGSDTTNGFDGYEDAAIAGASAVVNQMEGDDPSFYIGAKMARYRDIDEQSAARDRANPDRVLDVTGALDYSAWPDGPGWQGH